MDFLREFRDSSTVKGILKEIEKPSDTPLNIMEICGSHTHTIMRFGLDELLRGHINFIHGPGCPVCVMPKERIDHAIVLSRQEDIILATVGDMIRVPGSKGSLITERVKGGDIRIVYSPMDVLYIARDNPDKIVVYFAIGFETTTPATAVVMEGCIREEIKNILFHVNHVLVPPPIDAIMASGDVVIDAFIAPGHVSVITGAGVYRPIVEKYRTPMVICGFEPLDVLLGIWMILRQFREQRCEVEIQYKRAVRPEGNLKAQGLINRYLQLRESFRWRGIGDIPLSGMKIKDEFAHLDAEVIFKDLLPCELIDDHRLCKCGEILKGRLKPIDCSVFGTACTPQNPMGACMVSAEGACQAYYKYKQLPNYEH